jgi:hypothetical protein
LVVRFVRNECEPSGRKLNPISLLQVEASLRSAYLAFLLVFILMLFATLVRQDLQELRRGRRRVRATVLGHLTERSPKNIETFAAMFRIDEGPDAGYETTDPVFRTSRIPPNGTQIVVVYPVGDPSRAHLPHPWIRPFSYASLLLFFAVASFLLFHH